MKGKTIVVWFSCGAPSAVAAKRTIELYGEENTVMVVNNPVIEEDEDNRRFLKDVEEWIGQRVFFATNKVFPSCSAVDVWEKKQYMSGVNGATCTSALKREARYQFELENKIDWHVMGFTLEEKDRHQKFVSRERANLLPVLIDLSLTREECFEVVSQAGIALPRVYKMGYPNANCIGCVKATSPTYWNHVRKNHPEVFAERAEQSRRIGTRLVRHKGERIFLDDLPATARGAKIKSYECGIFCLSN